MPNEHEITLERIASSLSHIADGLVEQFEQAEEQYKKLAKRISAVEETINERFSALTAALAEKHISREDVLTVIRGAIDDVRQGLALRAMGASPWPPAVPSPDAEINSSQREDSVRFVVGKSGRTTISFPALTWKGAFTAVKWAVLIVASGAGTWAAISKLIKAFTE